MLALLSYICILGISLMYTLYLDGETGIIMLAFFILSPVISTFLTLISKSGFKITLDASDDCLKKASRMKLRIIVRKKRIFPTPLITIKIKTSLHFEQTEITSYRFSLAEAKEYVLEHSLDAKICGNAKISIEKAFISDYLGIMKINLIKKSIPEISVYIKPDVPQTSNANALFTAVSSSIFSNDDDDDEAVALPQTLNTVPGYEYREYVPGDSLKKINWKLSMKKDNLYVRLDESAPRNKPIVLMDFTKSINSTDDYESLMKQQRLIEGALAMLLLCIKQGVECFVGYPKDDEWILIKIDGPEDVYEVAIKTGCIPFEFPGKRKISRLPDSANEKKKSSNVFLFYTLECDDRLYSEITRSELNGNIINVIDVGGTGKNSLFNAERLWQLMDDYEVKAALE